MSVSLCLTRSHSNTAFDPFRANCCPVSGTNHSNSKCFSPKNSMMQSEKGEDRQEVNPMAYGKVCDENNC